MTSHLGYGATIAPVNAATIFTARAWNLKPVPDVSTSPAHKHKDDQVDRCKHINEDANMDRVTPIVLIETRLGNVLYFRVVNTSINT
jgi:hypothetical protein